MTTTQMDYRNIFSKSYDEIRKSQTSLVSLVESVPGTTVTVLPVTTVKFAKIETELTIRRNGKEIQVFESFFPVGDTKYMCGICMEQDTDAPTYFAPEQRRELIPDLIRKHTETTAEPISEQEINRLKYLMSDISAILSKHGASLDAVPGGLRLRTGEPGQDTVALTLVDKEAE